MKPSKLKIENFMSIESAELDLASRGLVLVLGEVRDGGQTDSNGAGKSAIFDAITWALWGEPARALKKADDVVRWQSGKDCLVRLDFEVDGTDYAVIRTRASSGAKKPNDLELLVDGESAAGHSNKATQDKINSVISLDYTTFCAMMPGTHIKATEMTDKDIKVLLETLLQAESFEEAYLRAREEKRSAKSELDKCTAELEFSENTVKRLQAEMSQLSAEERQWREKRDKQFAQIDVQVANLLDEIDKLKAKAPGVMEEQVKAAVKAYTDLAAKQDAELLVFKNKKAELTTQIETLTAHINKLNSFGDAEGMNLICPACDTRFHAPAELYNEVELLEEKLKELNAEIIRLVPDMKEKRSEAKTKAENHQAAWDRWVEARNKLSVLEPQVELLEKQRESLSVSESPYNDLYQSRSKLKAEAAKEVKKLTKAVKEAQVAYDHYDFWVKGFSPAGIRSFVMQYIVPILNDRANHYCELLTDNQMSVSFSAKTVVGGKEKDQFSIDASFKNGSQSYGGCSKGERARVNLVVALCLGDLAALRTRKTVPFRFLDEPFENVDGSGIDSIMRLLHDYSKKYESVFLISHNDVLKAQFSNVITVVKENGVSSING